jgi:anti-anti-sigma regulatory factor
LDTNITGRLWREAMQVLQQSNPMRVVIDASEVTCCDGSGVAFIVTLQASAVAK